MISLNRRFLVIDSENYFLVIFNFVCNIFYYLLWVLYSFCTNKNNYYLYLHVLNFIWFINGDLCMRKLVCCPVSIALLGITTKWQADDRIQLWARGEYRSERARYRFTYANLTTTEKGVYDALGDDKAYALMHVGSNFNINDKVDIGVGLYHVFDKKFVDYQNVGSLYYNRYRNTQEGRRVQLSTTFKF